MQHHAVLVWYTRNEEVPEGRLLGADRSRVLQLCKELYGKWREPYKDCYISPTRPRLRPAYYTLRSSTEEFRKVLADWVSSNPEEVRKEMQSIKQWDCELFDTLQCLEQLVGAHGLRVEWLGKIYEEQDTTTDPKRVRRGPMGDRFLLYWEGEKIPVAMIQC